MVAASSRDEIYMQRALFHAARGRGRTTPNPMVGAVVLTPEGVIAGQGYHERAGEPHAEVHALAAAGDAARGATLYVTLEPCCHIGRTGPCTTRIIDAGIARVVAAMQDPDPRVSGKGFEELRARGISVDVGVCAAEAERLNQAFITMRVVGRPLVMLKAALSLDACVAAQAGARTSITSSEANRRSQWLRASIDAIAVGSETVLVDDPLLTARGCYRERPLTRVIFDRRVRTPPQSRVLSTLDAGPVIIVTAGLEGEAGERASRLSRAGAQIIESATLDHALATLAQASVSTVLVEGGPTIQRAFMAAQLVDRVHMVVAPTLLGEGGTKWLDVQTLLLAPEPPVTAEPRGPDIWIEADVHRYR